MISTVKDIYARLASLFLNKNPRVNDEPFTLTSQSSADSGLVATIIVPIRVNRRSKDALTRLQRLLSFIPECFEVVVVDDGSTRLRKKEICRLVMDRPQSRYLYLPTQAQRFSLARARNRGATYARSDIVLFHDLDFMGNAQTYLQIADIIRDRLARAVKHHFFCVPVAFLTETGTQNYLKFLPCASNATNWRFYQVAERNGEVKFLVQGSSCIVVRKDYFLEIGGHDESYDGHGAEDFELLHRLSSNYPIAKRPVDYPLNTGSGKIIEYRGFRAFFALYGQDCVRSECVLIHLYHPKRKESGYYQHERNFAKLKSLMLDDASRADFYG